MSRATVRAAIVAWFAPPNVPGLNAVFTSKRKNISGQEFFGGQVGVGSGAIAWVYFERKHEVRRAFGGMPGPSTGGKKRVTYTVGLVVNFRSNKERMEDAADDHDALMDAIEARLRLGRTLGDAVFSAGEGGETGREDIETLQDMPKLVGQETVIFSALRFEVVEWITS